MSFDTALKIDLAAVLVLIGIAAVTIFSIISYGLVKLIGRTLKGINERT